MKHPRLVLALIAFAILGGTTAAASAADSSTSHMVCVINQDPGEGSPQHGVCLVVDDPQLPSDY